jgi:hypothetical protein
MAPHHQLALQQALAWITTYFEPLGVVASGSIVRGNPHATSDLDLHVVHEKAFRQRVQKRFNGVPCEIFVNNPAQVRAYFASELRQNRPVTAHLLATGQVVHGHDNPHLLALVEEASYYATLANPLTQEQATFRKYGLATLLEDAADTLATDEATSLYLLDQVVAQLVEFVFAAHQRPLPRIKERLQVLGEVDATVGRDVRQYYQPVGAAQKYAVAKALVLHVAEAAAFFEWSSVPA